MYSAEKLNCYVISGMNNTINEIYVAFYNVIKPIYIKVFINLIIGIFNFYSNL